MKYFITSHVTMMRIIHKNRNIILNMCTHYDVTYILGSEKGEDLPLLQPAFHNAKATK